MGELKGIVIDFDNPLGIGEEGFVWKTSRNSAVKVFDRSKNFKNEIDCYLIFGERGINEIAGFTVPELLGNDEGLRVIEMSIVAAPYVLDFGKAWVGRRPEFTEEQLQDHEEEVISRFEGN